jgi:lysylphosphatidylglycerol synthetase-like protein (DUF2156 family)
MPPFWWALFFRNETGLLSLATLKLETSYHISTVSEHPLSRRARRRLVTQSRWASEQSLRVTDHSQTLNLAQRRELLERHGDFSLAYSTAVQPLLSYFGDDTGYIAYRQRWGVTFALGDPVSSIEHRASLVTGFNEQFPKSVFCQISEPTAAVLSKSGWFVNEMGVDTRLILDQYTLGGKEKEWLRYAANWVNRRGYEVREADFDSIDPDEVELLSEAWRKTRTVKRKEVRFLNRPIVLEQEKDVRRFFLFNPHGKMEAFVFFDPLYRNRQIIGYVTTFKRRCPAATQYAEHAIMKTAIETFKSEGGKEIRLGLSPGAWLTDSQFHSSKFVAKIFRSIFQSQLINHYAYHLQGHASYKRRFRGVEEKVYFACRYQAPVRALTALVGLCGIV